MLSDDLRFALPFAAAAAMIGVIVVTTSALSEERTLIDQYGNEVTFDAPVDRLATVPIPAAAMSVAEAGSSHALDAMHGLSKTAIVNGILGDFFPETRDIPSDIVGDGFMPNVEELLSVDPELVLQWGTRGDDIIAPIVNAGLPVVTLRYGTEEDAAQWLGMMGQILGREDRSDAILAWRSEALADMQAATGAIPDNERPRTLYFLRYLSSLRVAGTGTYNDFTINLAGGSNVAAELNRFNDVSPEQILAWDPEVILLNGFEDELSPEDVYSNPVFADVSAVRNRRVYQLPLGGYRWDPPNQESPLTWAWAASLLHPEQFNVDIRSQIEERYALLYGQVPSEDQIDGILRMARNGGSANYDRFAR
ncbi:MAG: ABC transporter substrate-binding protein [Cohaesibacteraceae bacterium]